jgi:hypothetical protein
MPDGVEEGIIKGLYPLSKGEAPSLKDLTTYSAITGKTSTRAFSRHVVVAS